MNGLDLDPELLTWLALRRVVGGRVVCLAPGRYVDGGRPIPGYIAEALAGLTTAGLVDEVDDPQQCTRMLALTEAGTARYAELGQRQRTGLSAPPPEFPQTPAGHRSSLTPRPSTAPGDQPDPTTRTRWVRCPDDGRLHAVDRLDVEIAPVRGHIEALCGYRLRPRDLHHRSRLPGRLLMLGVRARWSRVRRYGPRRRWGYNITDRSPGARAWSRMTRRFRRPVPAEDRSDGRDYRGWTARVAFDEDGILPVGAEGPVVASMRSGGELLHRIELPDHSVTAPLPWPGLDLIPPQGA